MRHRTDIISTLPARRLFVSRSVVNGETFYVGRIPVGVHDAARHTVVLPPGRAEAALAANAASVFEIIGVRHGVTLQFAADMARIEGSYENGSSLAWRDAGALLTVISLVAEALGLAGTPLGRAGELIVAEAGLLPPRWMAVGALHLTAR